MGIHAAHNWRVPREWSPRVGRNPKTGEKVSVPGKYNPD
ncbi:HU family DNA-binding protein [Azonexus fungiphilus]